ncbi:PAS domain S-box-containing protein [Desulfobaculum xiamenense]|uniref:PAS domain S-box-containing protein n=1 Tax=Desulfobaculum xiamenense TaxID=995050 RepID=A0A846QMW0_9BACT|nr:PAS domain S-box-containing protein [Desulfobaculum xiamenense]
MIVLGSISAYDADSFNNARRKILRLTEAFGFDSILCTKITTFYSELCRLERTSKMGTLLKLGLEEVNGRLALSVFFDFGCPVCPPPAILKFFGVSAAFAGKASPTLHGMLYLPNEEYSAQDYPLEDIIAMLAQPSRQELIRSITNKNAELAAEVEERQRTEAALRESEGRIQTVLEGAPDAMIMVNRAGTITYANSQAVKTFGYSREELLGSPIEILVPEEARQSHPAHVQEFFRNNADKGLSGEGNFQAQIKGGLRIATDIKLSPIKTGDEIQIIASIRDVTEQKKAQEVIKKLSQVVEQCPISVVITDRDGIIEYVNPSFCDVTGYSPEEILGHNPRILSSGKTPRSVYEDLWKTILDGQAWKGSFHNRRKNGEVYWESATIAPILNDTGKVTHFVAVKEDITERMLMEEAVRESEVKYRELVENANSIILKLDRSGNVTFFNEYAQEFFGFSEEEVLGKSIVGTIVPELESTGRDLSGMIMNIAQNPDEHANNENENIRKDGTLVWVNWTNRALLDEESGEVLGVLCVGLDITKQRKAQEERDKAARELDERNQQLGELSNKLSKYLSPQVYASIFSGARDVQLTTERKKLTVFFSDIKDFTKTTDDLQPEDLTTLLNLYFTEMSKIALEYGATIDKFIGDAMLMFFGDPQTLGITEDAKACVNMAIAMQRRMVELDEEWRDMGYEEPFRMRIGINTGYCNVGNFGSEDRMDYTIIGGEVNLAARLEAQADTGGILMSYETYALVSDIVATEAREPMTVKGIRRQVRPYAVLGLYDNLDTESRFISSQGEGLRLQLDMEKLTDERREAAVLELEKALTKLRSS